MGILSRTKTLFSGFVINATDKAENKNPNLLISEAENKIQKSRKAAQKQLVEVQTWAETVKMDMKEAELKLKDIQIKIQMAAEDNNKKLLTELFIKEEAIKNEYDEKASIYKAAVNEALRIRDNFRAFEVEMNGKLKELENMRKQSEIISIREKIANIDYKYISECEENIVNLRKSLNRRNAKLNVMISSRDNSIDTSVNNMINTRLFKIAEAKADAKLLEYKNKKADEMLPNKSINNSIINIT